MGCFAVGVFALSLNWTSNLFYFTFFLLHVSSFILNRNCLYSFAFLGNQTRKVFTRNKAGGNYTSLEALFGFTLRHVSTGSRDDLKHGTGTAKVTARTGRPET